MTTPSTPPGATITVEARAADTVAGLGGLSFVTVPSDGAIDLEGRYVEVRITLRAGTDGATPVLSDVRIKGVPPNQPPAIDLPAALAAGEGPTSRSARP